MDTAPLHEKLEDAYQALTDGRLQDALAAVDHVRRALRCETRLKPGPKPGARRRDYEGDLETVATLLRTEPRSLRALRGHLGVNSKVIVHIMDEAVRRGIARKATDHVRPGLACMYTAC